MISCTYTPLVQPRNETKAPQSVSATKLVIQGTDRQYSSYWQFCAGLLRCKCVLPKLVLLLTPSPEYVSPWSQASRNSFIARPLSFISKSVDHQIIMAITESHNAAPTVQAFVTKFSDRAPRLPLMATTLHQRLLVQPYAMSTTGCEGHSPRESPPYTTNLPDLWEITGTLNCMSSPCIHVFCRISPCRNFVEFLCSIMW